ncbi:MAG: hypothetical protein HPY74_13735 [Firmicutes bacterium]|nr:hypothetical protein [Bacillota bacterium]
MENEKLFQQNLIKTKCSQPEINNRLILRSRLSERLNRALTHKLTIVSAPAKGSTIMSNRIQDALPCLLSAIDEAIDSECPRALVPAITTISRIKRAQGDMNGALHVVQEYEGWLEKQGKPHWIYMLNAFKTRLHIDSGGTKKVEKWFASCKLGIYHEISRAKEFELIVYARVLMAKGLLSDADILLRRLLIFAEGAA